uniref:FLZ-type domain-containing protein n=1 Tax=Zea mays TaxID=4577 RepID=A0A804QLF4_MAIZE
MGKQASEYADCEEYTCVISRGADPRTTHILVGETVEVRRGDVGGGYRKVVFSIEPLALSDRQPPVSSSSSPAAPARVVASGCCCCCMKRLLEDRDIFIYLGEKAFCSDECRNGFTMDRLARTILSPRKSGPF